MVSHEGKIHIFHRTVSLPDSSADIASKSESARLLHQAAWSLLAESLHGLYPERFPGDSPELLPEIETGINGKPGFADRSLPEFSLSHSGSVAVCAISEYGPVGVDVQEMRDMRGAADMDAIVTRFFHPREQEYYFSFDDPGKRRQIFYCIFSSKEAYVKLTGLGLQQEFRDFYTVFDENEMPKEIYDNKTGLVLACPMLLDLPIHGDETDYVLVCCSSEEQTLSLK